MNVNTSLIQKKFYYNLYGEIIGIIIAGNYEEKKVLDLLVELYRYTYYSGVKNSVDPRIDVKFKLSILSETKDLLLENNISSDFMKSSVSK